MTQKLNYAERKPHLVVPQDAVIRYSDGRTSVWIARREDQQWLAREQLVELGERFNGWIVIESGLSEDDPRGGAR